MALPLMAAAVSALAPELYQRGLDLLGGVFRGAVDKGTEQVAGLIRDKTGIDVNAIAGGALSDEQWRQLKAFEQSNQMHLMDVLLERERLRLQDTANARATSTERDTSDDRFVRRFTYYYAYLITGLTFAFIFAVIALSVYGSVSPDAWRMIDTVLGFLLGVGLSAVVQFFFGSSQGSQRKDDQLSRLTQGR